MTVNRINNFSSPLVVDNITVSGTTVESTSGSLIIESDGTNDTRLLNGPQTSMVVHHEGYITSARRPTLLYRQPSFINNITGAGAVYTMQFTEQIYDVGSDFSSDTTFTAPTTGLYLFSVVARPRGVTTNMVTGVFSLVTSNRTYRCYNQPSNMTTSTAGGEFTITTIVDMDALDVASATLQISGGTGDTADIAGTSVITSTYISVAQLT